MANTEKSGQYFIAYKGKEFSYEDIINALKEKCPSGYTVNFKTVDNSIFAKIVYDTYVEDRDPNWYRDRGILTVNGYNQNEITSAKIHFNNYGINDSDRYHCLITYMYDDYQTDIFKKLSTYMHFCSVIWDRDSNTMVAGVTEPDCQYTHLYYGYTKQNQELIFSNNENILEEFCDEITEMQENTYMKNGELYTLDGEKIDIDKTTPLITKTRQNADTLIDGLNALLIQVTNEIIRAKIEQNIVDYLSSDDPKKKISDFIDNETQRQILLIIKKVIEESDLENYLTTKLNELLDKKLEDYTQKVNVPVVHIVKLNDTVLGQTSGGFYHEKFEQILSQVQLDEPIMLIGPAGSGKNVSVSQVAQALGLKMYYTNNASNEFKLTGFIDAGGHYRETEFYKAFKNGGLFFLDEIDNSDPSALIVINSALANGYMAFPHETIDRHPDFRIVSAANTWGKGSDLQYVGRQALDGATLDRFDNIFFDYDTKLEQTLYPNDEVLQFMWAFRNAVYQTRILHIVSTRGIGKVYKKEINGIPVEHTLTSNVIKNLSQDDINTIIGNMQNVSSSNKYFEGIKRLRLNR